jgi:RimJ/RimL family protein N-acetyltransferase
MIRGDRQRQGLATEAFEGLAALLRDRGARVVRAGVMEQNSAGRELAGRLGFELVSRTVIRATSEEEVVVLERRL